MKKIIISLLIILILINQLMFNPVYATDSALEKNDKANDDEITYSQESFDDSANNGSTTGGNGESTKLSPSTSMMGTIVGWIAKIFNVFPMLAHALITSVVVSDSDDETIHKKFNIHDTIFGNYLIFDANYFDDKVDLEVNGTNSSDKFIIAIRKNVATWFYNVRLISMVISLGVLIYVGIRMAMSTIASDKATYKQMLLDWIVGIIILFMIQYLMIALLTLGDMMTGIFAKIEEQMLASGTTNSSFEITILDSVYSGVQTKGGLTVAYMSISYWALMILYFKFFMTYIKRVLITGFLIVVSPLLSVLYPIDKIGDGKAQSFNTWIKEFTINSFIQALHAGSYLVFAYTAGEIAEVAPIVGILFLFAITRVEKIVKEIFEMREAVSIKSVGESLK